MRVLLIEDEPNVAAFVKKGLTEESFAVDHAPSQRDGLRLALDESYDVLVVDRRLPDGDGLDLLPAPERVLTASALRAGPALLLHRIFSRP